MSGDLVGLTLLGVFPKIEIGFPHLTATEVNALCSIFNAQSFTVEYWNPDTQTTKTGTFYAGDYKVGLFNKEKEMFEPWEINLIAFNKQT